MPQISDYMIEMSSTTISDEDVERLLTGRATDSPDLETLTPFINSLRTYRTKPVLVDPEKVAEVAAVARQVLLERTQAPGQHTSRVRPPRLHAINRLATAAAAALIFVFGISGMAVAANGAAPGHPLYGVDMFFESIGFGNGGAAERMAEADSLLDSGDPDAAFVLLGQYLEQLEADGNAEAVEKVARHIELAATKSNPTAKSAQEKVALLKAFIELNKGEGVGVDGKEFGQGVSEIARSKGTPETAGPKEGKGKAPEHAGPPDK